MEKVIIIGAGLAGATMARLYAEQGIDVLVVDKRSKIAGNIYDYTDKNGILVQAYGPHIFRTDDKKVYTFLSQFTEWNKYEHRVLAKIKKKFVPIPFNLTSLFALLPKEKAETVKEALVKEIGMEKKVPILILRTHANETIREFADFVYKYVFYRYTKKQWGMNPEQVGENIINRVPVYISEDDRYSDVKYQVMPKQGFTEMVTNMLRHPRIQLKLHTDAKRYLALYNGKIYWQGEEFKGKLIYTGRIDELFNNKYGTLLYRTIKFKYKTLNRPSFQPAPSVNYTSSKPYNRISEFTKFTCEEKDKTVIVKEYPKKCRKKDNPYYPVTTPEYLEVYEKYKAEAQKYKNLYLTGRLASFKYYNMDKTVAEAMDLFKSIE